MVKVPSIKELVNAGAHLGHVKQKKNPKMQPFIYAICNKLCIIDLSKTIKQIEKALLFVRKIVKEQKSVLFVGTTNQCSEVVRAAAKECEEFYVCKRWLGGTLTNFNTIRQSIKKLEVVEQKLESGKDSFTKKELVVLEKEKEKLENNFSGIREMQTMPGLVVVVNPIKERIAIKECNKLGVPVIAFTDTNCNPDGIDYVIACNDDSANSISSILSCIKEEIMLQKSKLQVLNVTKKGE